MRRYASPEERVAVPPGEVDPSLQHRAHFGRGLLEDRRVLDDSEDGVEYEPLGVFHALSVVPPQHVGMHRGAGAEHAHVGDVHSVAQRGPRAVANAHHVSVPAYLGTDVRLAELEEQPRLLGVQCLGHFPQQLVYAVRDRAAVTSGVVLRNRGIGLALHPERVDEVELESVDVPFPQASQIHVAEVCAHLGESRIENPASEPRNLAQHLVPEPRIGLRLLPDERHREPDHVLHPHVVHFRDVGAHVREPVRRDVPVAARGIAPLRVVALPAVVEDHCLHAKPRGKRALALDSRGVDVLVEVVPCRVERIVRACGNCGGSSRSATLPFRRVPHGGREAHRARVEAQLGEELAHRLRRIGEIRYLCVEREVGLAREAAHPDLSPQLPGGDRQPVLVVPAEERTDRLGAGDVEDAAPPREDCHVLGAAEVRVPGEVAVDLRHGHVHLELRHVRRLPACGPDGHEAHSGGLLAF